MQHLLFGLIFSCFLCACNESSVKISTDTGKNERVIRKYFDHFNKHEWPELAAMYSDSADFKDPSLGVGKVKQSKKQIIDKYSVLTGIFPDLKDEIISIYPSADDFLIVEFISRGTAPDKTKFELPICTIFKLKDGLITEDFTYYDNSEE